MRRKSSWIDRLSSTSSMRRLGGSSGFMVRYAGGGKGQNEGGAQARSWTAGGEIATHFAGGEHAAMQTKAVATGLRGETVLENPREVGGGNTGPIILHAQRDRLFVHRGDLHPNDTLAGLHHLQRIFRVLQ